MKQEKPKQTKSDLLQATSKADVVPGVRGKTRRSLDVPASAERIYFALRGGKGARGKARRSLNVPANTARIHFVLWTAKVSRIQRIPRDGKRRRELQEDVPLSL